MGAKEKKRRNSSCFWGTEGKNEMVGNKMVNYAFGT